MQQQHDVAVHEKELKPLQTNGQIKQTRSENKSMYELIFNTFVENQILYFS